MAGLQGGAVEADSATHLPELARRLSRLSLELYQDGRPSEGLAPSRESANIRGRLATRHPEAHLADHAMALNNLAVMRSAVGRQDEALTPMLEAADIRRRLAAADPGHLADHAMALNNLGVLLSSLGRGEEAMVRVVESVENYRYLARIDPVKYLPELANGLWAIGWVAVRWGLNRAAALMATGEALTILEPLRDRNLLFARRFQGALAARIALLHADGSHVEAKLLRRQIVSVK